MTAPRQPRDRVFLMTVYGCGLRISEATQLKTSDIDRARMQLRVRDGKGAKGRVLPLSERLLKELVNYWRAQRQSAPKRTDMETLCPSVQSNGEAASDQLTVGGILRLFLAVLLHLLKLSAHKLRVLWQLAVCGTPALGANLFHCLHCQHRHWAPRSCGNRHCPRCLAAKSWQWLEKQTRSL